MRHVALLRGINVGKAKRIAMTDLKRLVETLGYTEVRTLLNSGNVVFGVPKGSKADPAGRIEQALQKRLGVTSRVIVLSADELAIVIAENPLLAVGTNPSRLMVSVLADPADRAKLAPLAKTKWTPEAFGLGRRVAYLWCPLGVIVSPLSGALAKALGTAVTTRNWATMNKLHALLGAGT